jgi:hypothetical protein
MSKMNELSLKQGTALTIPTDMPTDDGWSDAAAEANERIIRGTFLKFSDWRWLKGKEGIELEDGARLVALGTAAAWVKWLGGKPAEYRMREPGKLLPERDTLGDLDKSQWEMGPDGVTPRDPWQSTRFVYLVDPETAGAFTFSTSSWGGRNAVSDLGDQIQRMRFARPGAVPIVELRAAEMKTKFGRKSKPLFRVVGWKHSGAEPPAAPAIENKSVHQKTAELIDDEIPF